MASPWWLLGLALLPLMRWLHRGGRHRRRMVVPHLALWRGLAAQAANVGTRTPPDPAWRRRALLVALVLLALAQPHWPRAGRPVTLWVDDSLSMLTREAGGTRLALGLAQARVQLAEAGATDVQLRTLGDPWRQRGAADDAAFAGVVAAAGQREPAPPPAALLQADREHWLLTDGAQPQLLAWPGAVRADRVVRVGAVDRNAGVERVSARRRADDPQQLEVRVRVRNGGAQAEARDLVVSADRGGLQRTSVLVAPGGTVEISLTMPWAASLQATLRPADALVEDDRLVLHLGPLAPVPLAVDGRCPAALQAALAVHSGLRVLAADSGDGGEAQARVSCSGDAAPSALPTLRVRAERAAVRAQGPWLWGPGLTGASRIETPDQGLPLGARLAMSPSDEVLLAVGGEAVWLRRPGPQVHMTTALDFDALGADRGPALPRLANLMLEQLLQRRLLGEVARVQRAADASRVLPQTALGQAEAAPTTASRPNPHDLTRPLLVLAALVLLWELLALWRQMRRVGELE